MSQRFYLANHSPRIVLTLIVLTVLVFGPMSYVNSELSRGGFTAAGIACLCVAIICGLVLVSLVALIVVDRLRKPYIELHEDKLVLHGTFNDQQIYFVKVAKILLSDNGELMVNEYAGIDSDAKYSSAPLIVSEAQVGREKFQQLLSHLKLKSGKEPTLVPKLNSVFVQRELSK